MNTNKIKIAILAMSSLVMVAMTASAILADIAAHYPDVALNTIQMVLAVPALLSMFFSLLSGPLSSRIPKKSLVQFGLIIGFIGGIMGLTLGTVHIYLLISASVLIGVSQGINATMTMALIADYFHGHERGAMMGLQSAFVNGGSMVILFVSGMLAGIRWNLAYLVFLLFIPILFVVWRNLPKENQVHEETDESADGKMNGVVYFNCIAILIYGVLLSTYHANVAMFIQENQLGNASTAGMINSLGTGLGMIAGIFYNRVKAVLKDNMMPVGASLLGIGMLSVYQIGTIHTVILTGFFAGLSMSLIVPTVMMSVSSAVSAAKSSNAIALANGSLSIGVFVSPFIVNATATSMRPGVLEFKFLMAGVGLIALAAIIIAGNYVINSGFALKSSRSYRAVQK